MSQSFEVEKYIEDIDRVYPPLRPYLQDEQPEVGVVCAPQLVTQQRGMPRGRAAALWVVACVVWCGGVGGREGKGKRSVSVSEISNKKLHY